MDGGRPQDFMEVAKFFLAPQGTMVQGKGHFLRFCNEGHPGSL